MADEKKNQDEIFEDYLKELFDKNLKLYIDENILPLQKHYEEQVEILKETMEKSSYLVDVLKGQEKEKEFKSLVIHPNADYKITNKLKELMAKKGIDSQGKLADRLDISAKTLSNIVNNKFNTSLEVALKLSYILGVTVNEIFELQYDDKEEINYPL